MAILLDQSSRILIQGFGRAGRQQARISCSYGSKIVAGVTPGRGGGKVDGISVYDTVRTAVDEQRANVSLIFVPAPNAKDAILEAADAGITVVICVTELVPTRDMTHVISCLKSSKTRLIGPNCPGVIAPKYRARAGIMPPAIYRPGKVGVISRSGTLVYEAVDQLSRLGIGQSSSIGVGGDPVIGTSQKESLELFEADTETDAVVLIGEIGGTAEQEAADYIPVMSKPVIAFIAGAAAPSGRRMGHAGAIVVGSAGTAKNKKDALRLGGAEVVNSPSRIGQTVKEVLEGIAKADGKSRVL